MIRRVLSKPQALDFFSGSGLVTEGLRLHFDVVWANDNCPKKNAVYRANFGDEHLDQGSIEEVRGEAIPSADLAWASFPCQDLSLAGNLNGMSKSDRTRSSLFWEWIRVLDEMPVKPTVLAVENVVGFLIGDDCEHFRSAYEAIVERGYVAGALEMDAGDFVPQSRPRCFLVAARSDGRISGLTNSGPGGRYHTASVVKAFRAVADSKWIWWKLPEAPKRLLTLTDLCQVDELVHPRAETDRLLGMLSDVNKAKLSKALSIKKLIVGAGYKRIRKEADGGKYQRLEIRFDGVAGCLRTPNGGSSRQIAVIVGNGKVMTRLLTPREAARLMGAPDTYKLTGSYNDCYHAMGDGVAVPVTRWIADHLLAPLAIRNPLKTRHLGGAVRNA